MFFKVCIKYILKYIHIILYFILVKYRLQILTERLQKFLQIQNLKTSHNEFNIWYYFKFTWNKSEVDLKKNSSRYMFFKSRQELYKTS